MHTHAVIAFSVFLGLVLFAVLIAVVLVIGRGLEALGRSSRSSIRQVRAAGLGMTTAVAAVALVACGVAAAVGYGIAAIAA